MNTKLTRGTKIRFIADGEDVERVGSIWVVLNRMYLVDCGPQVAAKFVFQDDKSIKVIIEEDAEV
jgi:hypothetical protein